MKLYNVGGMRYLKIRYEYIIVLMMILLICLVVGIISIIRGFRKIKEKDLDTEIKRYAKTELVTIKRNKLDIIDTTDKQTIYLTYDDLGIIFMDFTSFTKELDVLIYLPEPKEGLAYTISMEKKTTLTGTIVVSEQNSKHTDIYDYYDTNNYKYEVERSINSYKIQTIIISCYKNTNHTDDKITWAIS